MINFLKLILAIVGFAFLAEVSFGQGDAPPILKGLNQADKSIGAFIRTPNGQATKISSSSALIETGNNNILENPSFEHSVYDTSWVINSGSSSKIDVNTDSTKIVHGLNALKMTMAASPLDILNVSPTSNQSFKDGVQGLISVRVKTSVSGVKVCQRVGFSTNFNNCVNVTANGKWGLYKVPSILGEFYNGIVVTSQGVSITGDVYIDDAFVGPTDISQNMSACQTADCVTEFSAFVNTSNVISLKTIDFISSCTGTTDRTCTFITGIFTQTPNCKVSDLSPTATTAGANNRLHPHIMSVSNTSIRIVGIDEADTAFNNVAAFITCSKTGVDYTNALAKSKGNTYSSTNADTDWASCGHTTSSFTGFGTVSAIETQCKRQGSDLLMKGKLTLGSPTGVEARVSLPLWNGTQLISSGSSVIPSIQIAGRYGSGSSTPQSPNGSGNILIEPSVSYFTFSGESTAGISITKQTGSQVATGNPLSFNARIPIEGWQNSNIIIGQFNGLESCSSTLSCTDTFSAKVSATGVVTDENVDWISGNASVASATFTMTYNTGIFTVAPNCVVSSSTASSAALSTIAHLENNPTSTQVVVETGSPADAAYDFNIVCQKQGVDYIGKTAKAVASDQNLRSPGVTNSVLCSAKISATGVISDQQGGCFASCTNATTPVCTFTTNYWVGIPNCWVNSTSVGFNGDASATSTTLAGTIYNTAFNAVATSRNYICHGIKQ